jgi:hypothetical protein
MEEKKLDPKSIDIKEVKKELDQCDVRLSELKGKAKSEELGNEYKQAEQHLNACRLIVDEIEGKSGDETTDAKNRLVKSLSSMRRSMRHMGI